MRFFLVQRRKEGRKEQARASPGSPERGLERPDRSPAVGAAFLRPSDPPPVSAACRGAPIAELCDIAYLWERRGRSWGGGARAAARASTGSIGDGGMH